MRLAQLATLLGLDVPCPALDLVELAEHGQGDVGATAVGGLGIVELASGVAQQATSTTLPPA